MNVYNSRFASTKIFFVNKHYTISDSHVHYVIVYVYSFFMRENVKLIKEQKRQIDASSNNAFYHTKIFRREVFMGINNRDGQL